VPSTEGVAQMLTNFHVMFLPVLTLATGTIAAFSRYMRSSMMDSLAQDFVRTARAKGASRSRVLFRHALRNALIPIITLLGLSLPAIVSGAVITETVFNFPGMGYLTYRAADQYDIYVVVGTTIVATVATVVGSLVADPRIRYVHN
jgi:peptide/nickel transport system permease protein